MVDLKGCNFFNLMQFSGEKTVKNTFASPFLDWRPPPPQDLRGYPFLAPLSPISFILFSFRQTFCQVIGWHTLSGFGAHRGKSWIRHCVGPLIYGLFFLWSSLNSTDIAGCTENCVSCTSDTACTTCAAGYYEETDANSVDTCLCEYLSLRYV